MDPGGADRLKVGPCEWQSIATNTTDAPYITVAGAAVWLVVALASGSSRLGSLTLIDVLLLLAPLVVVPLGLRVAQWPRSPPPALVFGSAVALVPSFLLPAGVAAGLLSVPWLAVAAGVAFDACSTWNRERSWSPVALARSLAGIWLVVGAAALLATRIGLSGFGIEEPIVELTAVHYHFGAFAASLLAWRTSTVAVASHPRIAAVMAALVAGTPPVIAVGFATTSAVFQIGGGVLLTVGLWLLAGLVWSVVAPVRRPRPAALLLRISALAVVVPMALAVSWALGQFADVPALSIPDMARTHGVINAFGFTLCGMLGWLPHPDAPGPRIPGPR